MSNDLNSPTELCREADEYSAAAIITALAERGIHAIAVGGFTAGFIAEAPGDVAVMVAKADHDHAVKALDEIRRLDGKIDWSQVDVGDPESE